MRRFAAKNPHTVEKDRERTVCALARVWKESHWRARLNVGRHFTSKVYAPNLAKMSDTKSEAASSLTSAHRQNFAPAALRLPVILIVGLCLLLVGGLVFRDFVFGDKLLLYKDIGSDSVNDTYPTFVHLSDYVRHHGFPSWSFSMGMGQSLFYLTGSLILEPIVWLPRQLIAFALVFQHLLKALVAGLLFFRFLQLRGLNLGGSLAGALLLAFSAHMCMGSCWIISADDTLCFTFLLFATEESIVGRRWLFLPMAVALSGLVTVFHLYLSAVLLCLYVPSRLVEIYGWRPFVLSGVCARLATFAFLGVGLGAIVFLGSSYAVLNTPRASMTVANFGFRPAPHLFEFGSSLYYVTTVLRQFSSDIIGTGDGYQGWENYYEASVGYCGLLSLLLVPQAFVGATCRQRILYAVWLSLIAIPIIFPWFRHLFWLFRGAYFRTFSLFSIFILLVMGMTALSRYIEGGTINLRTLGATGAVLLCILHCPIREMQLLINHELAWTATVFLTLYAALLIIGRAMKQQSIIGWAVIVVAVIEVIHFDRVTVNRPTVTKQELNQRIGYNDQTVDAVREIKSSDESFFRITKTWGSGLANRRSDNDAMVFGYYSTLSYSTYNNINYIKFLLAVDVISSADAARQALWSPGLIWQPLLSTFACEKYALTTNPVPFEMAERYEFLKRYEDIYLFRNKAFLPFGLTFDRYIPEEVFLRMPSWAKPLALVHAVVITANDVADKHRLSELSLDEFKQRIREASLPDVLAQRRATALEIRSFRETRIDGNVRLGSDGILVLQMPFDAGWHAFSDGQIAPVLKVDAGLLGVALKSGGHAVKLIYRPPFLFVGAAVTLMSCVILSWAVWRWPRGIHLPN